ncbi:hypothetical protein AOV_02660 [Anaplasma ovis str. Haibei]|uniref:P44/Msp2 family outer membrane protein n=1 Tax=Anaplasma ovis str. Haibei TaxID=1248439 RepID=A0A2Z2L836_9RICK|nr:hypothetical protein AOV_02660 [Anaplasma ovis str. Haibei]
MDLCTLCISGSALLSVSFGVAFANKEVSHSWCSLVWRQGGSNSNAAEGSLALCAGGFGF